MARIGATGFSIDKDNVQLDIHAEKDDFIQIETRAHGILPNEVVIYVHLNGRTILRVQAPTESLTINGAPPIFEEEEER